MVIGPLITSIFNINSIKNYQAPWSISYETSCLFTYGSFAAQWKGQKLAGKILLTWTKSLLVRSFLDQKAHQNHQLIAEMFVFPTDRFGGGRVKILSKITEFTFFWPENGTGGKLGNTLYAGTQVTLQNKGTRTSPARLSFVLKVPLTCVPAKLIPYHVTGSCKGPIVVRNP